MDLLKIIHELGLAKPLLICGLFTIGIKIMREIVRVRCPECKKGMDLIFTDGDQVLHICKRCGKVL